MPSPEVQKKAEKMLFHIWINSVRLIPKQYMKKPPTPYPKPHAVDPDVEEHLSAFFWTSGEGRARRSPVVHYLDYASLAWGFLIFFRIPMRVVLTINLIWQGPRGATYIDMNLDIVYL